MAGRKREVQIQIEISNEQQWAEALAAPGLIVTVSIIKRPAVIDVYQRWCGPCKAVQNIFRKLRTEYGDDLLRFGVGEANSLLQLTSLKGKCQPVFLFYSGGKLVSIVEGVNGPLLQKTILKLVEEEKKKLELGAKYVPEVEELFLEDSQPAREKPPQTLDDTVENEDDVTYHVVIIKPDAVAGGQAKEIIRKVLNAGFSIVAEEERILDEQQICAIYEQKSKEPEFVKAMSSGPVHILILLKGESGDESPALKDLIDPVHAELLKPPKRSKDVAERILDLSDNSKEMASRQLAFFFPSFNVTSEAQGGNIRTQKTLALIRPSLLKQKKDEILKTIHDSGFHIAMQKEVTLSEEQAKEFYQEHQGTEYFSCLINHMTSGPVLALALTRDDAIQHWRRLLGPKLVEEAKEKSPESFRAQFSIENVPINQLHGSSTAEEAESDLQRFFPTEETLAVIKPDSSPEHQDTIVNCIKKAGFSISQIKETHLTREMAEEFYRDHKGKEFYDHLVDYMSRGPSVMMILSKENAVAEWREMMGPTDPEQAKVLKPDSLRAQFAKSILENAVHGSSNTQHALDNIKFIFGDSPSNTKAI